MSRSQPPHNTPAPGPDPVTDGTDDTVLRPDPRLDALLREALASGGLPPSVKSAQMAQLGIGGFASSTVSRTRTEHDTTATSSSSSARGRGSRGTATTIGADDLAPGFSSEIVWEDRPQRRLPRIGWLAAASVVLVVVLLATLLPDSGGNDNIASATSTPSSDLAASPDATATATSDTSATAEATPGLAPDGAGRVYIVGERAAQGGTRAEVIAVDASTGAIAYTLGFGTRVDAAVSGDGQSLYVAWTPPDGGDDVLAAYDALDGHQRWQVTVPDRVFMPQPPGEQPTSALLASTGDSNGRVSLVTCPAAQCAADGGSGQRVLRSFDARTGDVLDELALTDCDGAVYQHLAVGSAIVICSDAPPQRITAQGGAEPLFPEGALANRAPDAFVPGPSDGSIYFLYGSDVMRINSPTGMIIARFNISSELLTGGTEPFIIPSSTGLRLFVGSAPGGAHEVGVISTRTFTEDTRIATNPPLTSAIVAPGRDGRSLLGVSTTLEDGGAVREDAIVRYGLDGTSRPLITLAGFGTQRLLTAPQPRVESDPRSNDTVLATTINSDGSTQIAGWDTGNGEQVFSLPVGVNPDAVLSPDGATLYVGSDDALFAVDLQSLSERWRAEWPARTSVPPDQGPSALAISPDGTRLYVRSSAPRSPESGDHFVQIFDTQTGTPLGEIANAGGCAGRMHASSDNQWLWIICLGDTPLQVWNTVTGEQRPINNVGGTVIASEVIPQTDELAVLTELDGTNEVAILHMVSGESVFRGTVALLGDDTLTRLELLSFSTYGDAFLFGLGTDEGTSGPEADAFFVRTVETWEVQPTIYVSQPVNVPGIVRSARSDARVVASWDGTRTHLLRLGTDANVREFATTDLRLTRLIGATGTPISEQRSSSSACVVTQPTMLGITYGNQTRTVPEYAGNGMALRLGTPSPVHAGGMLVTWHLDTPALITAQAVPLESSDRVPLRLDQFVGQPTPNEQRMVLDLPVGCWEIVAATSHATFRATVRVSEPTPDAVLAHERLEAEVRRAALTPYPVPDTCIISDYDLYLRIAADVVPAWRFGPLSLPEGVLFQGRNNVLFSDYGTPNTFNAENPLASVTGSVDGGAPRQLAVQNVHLAGSATYGTQTFHDWGAELEFDSPGCWTLEITVGEFSDTATVYVYPQTVDTMLTQRSIERAETVASPPATCAATGWVGPTLRLHVEGASAYWLDGTGLALGTRLGTLAVGQNAVDWLRVRDFGSDIPVDQPITLHGTRLGTPDTPQPVALITELWTTWPDAAVTADDYDRAWRSILTIPESGCWHITAEFGTQQLNIVAWVPEPVD